MSVFQHRQSALHCEGVPLEAIAEAHGTPTYVYSRQTIESAFLAYRNALADRPHLICYAVKANSNLAILNVLAGLGAGFDVVSIGELERVIAAGGAAVGELFLGSKCKGSWQIKVKLIGKDCGASAKGSKCFWRRGDEYILKMTSSHDDNLFFVKVKGVPYNDEELYTSTDSKAMLQIIDAYEAQRTTADGEIAFLRTEVRRLAEELADRTNEIGRQVASGAWAPDGVAEAALSRRPCDLERDSRPRVLLDLVPLKLLLRAEAPRPPRSVTFAARRSARRGDPRARPRRAPCAPCC